MDIEIRFRPEYETYINNQLGDYIEYYKGQSSTSLYTNKSERIKNLENLKKNVSYRLQYRTDMNSKLKKNKLVQLPMSMREYDGWVQFVTNGGDIVYKGKSLIFILENDLNKTRIEIPLISTKKSTIISLNKGNKFYEDLVQFDKIKMFLKKETGVSDEELCQDLYIKYSNFCSEIKRIREKHAKNYFVSQEVIKNCKKNGGLTLFDLLYILSSIEKQVFPHPQSEDIKFINEISIVYNKITVKQW